MPLVDQSFSFEIMPPSVSINEAIFSNGAPGYSVKLQSNDCEMNIELAQEDLKALLDVASASWTDRKSLKLGRCLSKPTFWNCENGLLSVVAGLDDETWEVGIFLHESAIQELNEEIERSLRRS